jgi:hypothetical protein
MIWGENLDTLVLKDWVVKDIITSVLARFGLETCLSPAKISWRCFANCFYFECHAGSSL